RRSPDLYVERMRSTMRQIADALGTGFVDNPMWFFRRIVTVHPLGGAPIGDHPGEAVCDANGEVFGHPGLYIADGAAMPGPVGPNPSLTIAAMADRMCTRMLERSTEPGGSLGGAGGIAARAHLDPARPTRPGSVALSGTAVARVPCRPRPGCTASAPARA